MHKFKKVFFTVMSISLSLTLIFQILLLNDTVKEKLSFVHSMESQYVYSEQDIPVGHVKIKVSKPSKQAYVLQNGERVFSLDNDICTIDVYDNSVIEIDGTDIDDSFTVEIVSVSDNISGYYEDLLEISGDIVILGRFFVK